MLSLILTTATLSPSAGLGLSPPPQAPFIEQVPSYACDCKDGCQCTIPGGGPGPHFYICPKSYGQTCPVSGEVSHQPAPPQAPTTQRVRVQQCFLDNNGVQRCRMVEMDVPVTQSQVSGPALMSSQSCTTCGQSTTSGFSQSYSYSSSSYSSSNGDRRWWLGKHLGRQMPARLQARQGGSCQ